ncbi:MAG: MBL fold metallo-hydrolase [Holophagales bacterium]|nr:MBL fold metallo-hydrolase [Holophagales bacterium]
MLLRQIFDPKLAQYAYLIGCQRTGEALIIDPERDVDRYIELARAEGLRITAITETHIHADFLSGARELAEQTGARLYLSDEGDEDWKYQWVDAEKADGGRYDAVLLHDGDSFQLGQIEIRAVHTPGHTPEHLSFLVTDHGGGATEPIGVATGDFVFVGSLGRPDLLETAAGVVGQMEPSARTLYRSVDRFLDLPDFLQVWPGHGAGSACGKALGAVPSSTVGYEKRHNAAIGSARQGEDAFVDEILGGQPEPPLYFATMKRLNKEGPPILGGLPRPERLGSTALEEAVGASDTVIVDTRRDRQAFMESHLRGALFAPLDKSFPTIVGSYVRAEQRIVLVVEEAQLEEAVRDLVRIGFDHVTGFVVPDQLEERTLAGLLRTTTVIDFAELEARRRRSDTAVLDVRGAAEYASASVPGAANIAHTRLLARIDEVPEAQQLLVHCQVGGRASSAVSLLEREGHQAVLVDDNFTRWSEQAA